MTADSNRKPKSVRLFFALWPDPITRQKLASHSKEVRLEKKGRKTEDANLHMTLHFIGNTSDENRQCLEQQAARVPSQPFTLELGCPGFFPKQGIIWLGCEKIPAALYRLHRKLGQQIAGCDYEPEKRDYSPHITLYRKALPAAVQRAFKPILWHVDSFSLILSEPAREGVIYREIKRFAFQGETDSSPRSLSSR
jgi:2'-5' RNA ligase